MENVYADSDPRSNYIGTPSPAPYLDNLVTLVRQPLPSMAGSNLPFAGLFSGAAGSTIKSEDMSSIFARATTHLYMKTQQAKQQYAENSTQISSSACNLQEQLLFIRCAPPTLSNNTMPDHMIASTSNSNMCLNSSDDMMTPSNMNPNSHLILHELDTLQVHDHQPDIDNIYGLISQSSFSEIMLHAMEISEASRNKVIPRSNSLPLQASSRDSRRVSTSTATIQEFLTLRSEPPLNCPNSPSKQDSSVILSAEDSDGDQKLSCNTITKRRNCGQKKPQQKKVVYVPFCENKQRGEAPPSDTWAWRKYGQKPIKGSPFPRGYYRCSSWKGCPARKKVERNRNDPSMVMVTYTAEHNHPWPLSKPNSSSSKPGNRQQSQVAEADTSNGHYCNTENLFCSIINLPNRVEEQVVSSMEPLDDEEGLFLMQRDVDLCLSRTSTEGDDVFDNLGELPELSAIFSKGYIVDDYFDEEILEHSDLF